MVNPHSQTPLKPNAARIDRFALWLATIGMVMIPWSFAYWRFGVDGGIACIGVGFLLHSILTRNGTWLRGPIGLLMVAWVIWMGCVVSPLAESRPLYSFAYAWAWLRYPICFLALTQWLMQEATSRRLLWLSLAGATAVILLETLLQWWGGVSLSGFHTYDGRLTGPMRAPKVGILLVKLSVALTAVTLLMRPEWLSNLRIRFTAIGGLLLIALVVVASGERMAALLTLSATLIVLLVSFFRQADCRRAGIAALASLGLIIAALLRWSSYAHSRVNLLVQQMQDFTNTEYAGLYRSALHMWESSPLTGVGLRHYRGLCPKYLDPRFVHKCEIFIHPHNFALEWLAESGPVGLLLFYGVIFACLWPVLRWLGGPAVCSSKAAFSAGLLTLAIAWIDFFPIVATQGNWNNWSAGLSWFCFGLCVASWRQLATTASMPPANTIS